LAVEGGIELPQTVQDAMHVTVNIGMRFLWVDYLCIVQDNENHKNDQIASISAIYANASLTVIVASGENGNTGLLRLSRHISSKIS
jgi:hypothetical protein